MQSNVSFVVVESAMGWNGEVVHTRRVGAFSNRNDAERCVNSLNRPRGDDCYYIYSIEPQPIANAIPQSDGSMDKA